jgi:N-acetylated-alpha-linked acidic dipeptidase
MGLAALRLADAEVLPFDYTLYADRIARWLEGREAEARRAGGPLAAVAFGGVDAALVEFRAAAAAFADTLAAARARGDSAAVAAANGVLPRVEAAFLEPGGLVGRPWYRHVLNAPGSDTGYDPLPLPELAEAILAADADAASVALTRIERALRRAAALLR